MAFSTFTELLAVYILEYLDHFHHVQKKPHTFYLLTPNYPIPPSPRQSLLSISNDLPILNISCKLNHTKYMVFVIDFFHLACFQGLSML